MKKIVTVFMVLLSFVGCRNTTSTSSGVSPTNEINSSIPADSPFAAIQNGMAKKQVLTILGPPSDENGSLTGKAYIPFYVGSDQIQETYIYVGLGKIHFGSGLANSTPTVKKVEYDPGQPAFQGKTKTDGSQQTAPSSITQIKNQPLPANYLGILKGTLTPPSGKKGDDVILYLSGDKFTWENTTYDCSGSFKLINITDNSVELFSIVEKGKHVCTNYSRMKLSDAKNNSVNVNEYFLGGKPSGSGIFRKEQ